MPQLPYRWWGRSRPERFLFTSILMLENAEIVQVCPMPTGWFRDLDAFHISLLNKQIGSEEGDFCDREALLDSPPKSSMKKLACVHYAFRWAKDPICETANVKRGGADRGEEVLTVGVVVNEVSNLEI